MRNKRNATILILLSVLMSAILIFSGCSAAPSEERTEATLYLPNAAADGFDTVTKKVTATPQGIIDALIKEDALPKGTAVREFRYEEGEKRLYLDVSGEFHAALLSTGSTGETFLIGSLVNTLLDFYDAETVKLSSENLPISTGHNIYEEPLGFVSFGVAEETVPVRFWAEPAYWQGHLRIPLYLENPSEEPFKLGRDFKLERLDGDAWTECEPQDSSPALLDNPGIQFPIEPGEICTFLAWIGNAATENSGQYMPEGRYRLTIILPDGSDASAEFDFQKEMPEHDEFTVSAGHEQYPAEDPSVTMRITNNTGSETSFGVEYSLEQLVDGEWSAVRPESPLSFNAIAVMLPAGETHEFHINLGDYGLDLEPGRYRLVKQLGLWYYAAEFKLI